MPSASAPTRRVGALLTLLALTGLLVPLVPSASAETSGQTPYVLPQAVEDHAAAWIDGTAVVFGGQTHQGPTDVIQQIDVAQGTTSIRAERLPSPLADAAAVTAGQQVYLLGGLVDGQPTDAILVWNAASGSVTKLATTLPRPVHGGAAVWTGEVVYLLGGNDTSPASYTSIVRFDPGLGLATELEAELPIETWGAGAVWRDGSAYLIGGETPLNGGGIQDVVRFTPATGELSVLEDRLPQPHARYGLAWTGERAHLVGGQGPGTSTIQWYEPGSDRSGIWPAHLPEGRMDTAAVWTGSQVLSFGGWGPGGAPRTTVTVSDPDNQAPEARFEATVDGDQVHLDGSFSVDPDGQVTSWYWVLGDGNTAEGATLTHTYDQGGQKMVSLVVTDDDHATAQRLKQVNVTINQPPRPQLLVSVSGYQANVDLRASSDPDGEIVESEIAWGDGTSDLGPVASHVYDGAGRYTLTGTVWDDRGASRSASRTVTVGPPPEEPPPEPEPEQADPVPIEVTTDGLSVTARYPQDPDHPAPGDARWVWGDGESTDGLYEARHVYAQAGTYTLFLVDKAADQAVAQRSVTVEGPPEPVEPAEDPEPAAEPVLDPEVTVSGLVVHLDATESLSQAGEEATVTWRWGDGSQASNGSVVEHTYPAPGTYTIDGTITADSRQVATTSLEVAPTTPTPRGRLLDPDGKARAGAGILLLAQDGERFQVVDTTRTDEAGAWAIDADPRATHVGIVDGERVTVEPLDPAGDPITTTLQPPETELPAEALDALVGSLETVRMVPVPDGAAPASLALEGFAGIDTVELVSAETASDRRLVVAELRPDDAALIPRPRGAVHGWFSLTLVSGDGRELEVDEARVTFQLPAEATEAGPPALGHFQASDRSWRMVSAEPAGDGLYTAELAGFSLFTRSTLPPPLPGLVAQALMGPWGLAVAGAVLGVSLVPGVAGLRRRLSRGNGSGPTDGPAVRIQEARVRRDGREVLAGVDLTVERGEVVALVGPSGAGKSTLLSLLSGQLKATGTVEILGRRPRPGRIGAEVGTVPQDLQLYPRLTVAENVAYFGRAHGLGGRELKEATRRVLDTLDLEHKAGELVDRLSGGEKRRASVAATLVHGPRLLLLDEPTSGLDPVSRKRLWRHLRRIERQLGVTVLVTTHFLDEGDLADRVAILDHGRIVADGVADELITRLSGGHHLVIAELGRLTPGEHARLERELATGALPAGMVDAIELVGRSVRATTADPSSAESALAALLDALDVPVRSIGTRPCRLEDVFARYTGTAWEEVEA